MKNQAVCKRSHIQPSTICMIKLLSQAPLRIYTLAVGIHACRVNSCPPAQYGLSGFGSDRSVCIATAPCVVERTQLFCSGQGNVTVLVYIRMEDERLEADMRWFCQYSSAKVIVAEYRPLEERICRTLNEGLPHRNIVPHWPGRVQTSGSSGIHGPSGRRRGRDILGELAEAAWVPPLRARAGRWESRACQGKWSSL